MRQARVNARTFKRALLLCSLDGRGVARPMKAAADLWQFIRRDADVGARHGVTAPMTWPGRRAGNAVTIPDAP
jgi:hypothetical protein